MPSPDSASPEIAPASAASELAHADAPSQRPRLPWRILGIPLRNERFLGLKALAALLLGLYLSVWPPSSLGIADAEASRYYEESLRQAGASYLMAASVNAAVSVIKDTSLNVAPAGVGMEVAVGELVDPLNDLSEQLSTLLLTSIMTLTVVKLIHEILIALGFPIIGVFLIAGGILLALGYFSVSIRRFQLFFRLSIWVLAFRLTLPMAALVSTALNARFFQPQIQDDERQIAAWKEAMHQAVRLDLPEVKSPSHWLTAPFEGIYEKFQALKRFFAITQVQMTELIHAFIRIGGLYFSRLVINILLLPFLMFKMVSWAGESLFGARIEIRS